MNKEYKRELIGAAITLVMLMLFTTVVSSICFILKNPDVILNDVDEVLKTLSEQDAGYMDVIPCTNKGQ